MGQLFLLLVRILKCLFGMQMHITKCQMKYIVFVFTLIHFFLLWKRFKIKWNWYFQHCCRKNRTSSNNSLLCYRILPLHLKDNSATLHRKKTWKMIGCQRITTSKYHLYRPPLCKRHHPRRNNLRSLRGCCRRSSADQDRILW